MFGTNQGDQRRRKEDAVKAAEAEVDRYGRAPASPENSRNYEQARRKLADAQRDLHR